MEKLQILLLVTSIVYCLGGGGGHGGEDAATTPEGGEGVMILIVPREVKFKCNLTTASGDAVPVNWYKDSVEITTNERITIPQEGELLINPTEAGDVGSYRCQSPANSSLARSFELVQIMYKNLPKSTTALEGDKFSLTCDAEGTPEPVITWAKENQPIEVAVNDSRLELRTSEKGLPNATMVISNISQLDRGHYTCFITVAPTLVFNTTTNVRVKDIYAALWPFLGIVAEVVVLCLVIFIYEKHRTKNDFEESDTDQGTSGKGGRN